MSQPAFWLKITPAYVIENFEDLLNYVAAYNYYENEDPNSDFNRTVNFLTGVAEQIANTVDNCPPEIKPNIDIDFSKALRITAAAILAEYKRGGEIHNLILALLNLLIHSDYPISPEFRRQYINVASACARRAKIVDMPLKFEDLDPSRSSESVLLSRLAHIKWNTSNAPRAYYEGVGSVTFDANGIEIIPMNHDDILSSERKRRRVLEITNTLHIADVDSRRPNKQVIGDLFDWWPGLVRDLKGVKPSRKKVLKKYSPGDPLDVRVTSVFGIKVVCESFDPNYEKIEGKMLLNSVNLGVNRDDLLKFLKPGDILPAIYVNEEEFTFNFNNEEELDFKIDLLENTPESYVKAVFVSNYTYGTRWFCDAGVNVNVISRYQDDIDFDAHGHEGACVKLTIIETKPDKNGNIVTNGRFVHESEQNLPDVDVYTFRREAGEYMAKYLLSQLRSYYDNEENINSADDILAPRRAVIILAMLTLQNAINEPDIPSPDRVAQFIGANALFECAFIPQGAIVARRELAFQSTLADFAMGNDPSTLSFFVPSEISRYPRSLSQTKIISILKNYKELNRTIRQAFILPGEKMKHLESLVEASNTLLDKIDEAEISRIKKVITVKLGVGDLFVDTNTHRTFYGFENDTTEFKISCALPPQNMRGDSFEKDAQAQAFVIIKTVCAFLNSESGGDLLIGVNDEGYAVGIRNDIDLLYSNRMIAEPNPDRVRVYIKNIIDRAFISNDGNTSGSAITAGNVTVNIEESKENQYIIRIKTNPYPYDVVKIKKDYVLPGYKNVFFRSSGTSMPLDTDGIRNVRIRKISRLDENESKIAIILEAIDKKKQLSLKDYRSPNGLITRRIEPHILMPDNISFQAYDHTARQMRLFRLSRIGSVEMLPTPWEAEKKHRTLPVDIFGTIQSDEFRGTDHKLKLTDYAHMLLIEEFPAVRTSEDVVISQNTDSDAKKFPWIVRLTTYNPAGINRFLRGLPDDILPC